MRNPYHVGRWVRGRNHYGRHLLIDRLLSSSEAATWLVGTRRMGKTSLLRQLEACTHEQRRDAVALFWDLQGCETSEDLAYELELALEDAQERLAAVEIGVDALPAGNAAAMLRALARLAEERGVAILLLIDEAEALLSVAKREAKWLSSLRKALLEGRLRTVMTSTRLLSQLNQLSTAWATSPFLFGFELVNLWTLTTDEALALVRQTQGRPVQVADGLAAQILAYTNCHPYLIQYLCERLFVADETGTGKLRPIEDDDLQVDHLLAGFFLIDFQNLTRVERRMLLRIATFTLASESEILSALYDIAPQRIRTFLYALARLGYLRAVKSQWTIGNEFLRRWIAENHDELCRRLDSPLDEDEQENNLREGNRSETMRLRRKIALLERELENLQRQFARAEGDERAELHRRIRAVRDDLARLREELSFVVKARIDVDE